MDDSIPEADKSRILGFDGLRALAMTMVFFQHKSVLGQQMRLWVGVTLFFVLSGYLITGILLKRRVAIEAGLATVKGEIVLFFYNRSFRIFPAYYVMLLILAAISVTVWPVYPLKWLPIYGAYLTNLFIEYKTHFWPDLGHLWTLAVEEQFYIIAAPLFLFTPRRFAKYVIGGIILFGAVVGVTLKVIGAPDISFSTDPFVNFIPLAAGGFLALTFHRAEGQRSYLIVLGLVGLVISVHLPSGFLPYLPAAFAAVVIGSTLRNQNSTAVRILNWKPFRELGKISYAFYLWHYVVKFDFIKPYMHAVAPGSHLETATVLICDFAFTLAIAILSWRLVEAPMLDLRKSMSASLKAAS